jgi:FAD/FMN-containing dehydrogenase
MSELKIKGKVIYQGDTGFDAQVMSTLFNQRDPGRRPAMMVQPQEVDDVIATVRYARSRGLQVSICSGGHSWSANHLRPGGLLIDMAHFNQYHIDREKMVATAGPAVGGSILLGKLFDQGLFFPAGHCKGVCIGGYLLQGGFAWNGRKLGMACESVLGLDIVTADGELVHASATENPDLYWAARGSGGGFFGVVVRFYLRLYPRPKYSGMILHAFSIKYLDAVFEWAHAVGPSVPAAVEFQLLMSRKTLSVMGPGIEVAAPVFADSKEELMEATAFMRQSPIKSKAYFRSPFFRTHINTLYYFAMTHYPENHHWGVDNMWTRASIAELLPYLRNIAADMPPPPTHLLWLNWQPPQQRQDMAFSMEDQIYIALYGAWKSAQDTPNYGEWATRHLRSMEHLGTGIQLADENLHQRSGKFLATEHLQQLDEIRAQRDPSGVFQEWHSRPKY